MKKKTFFKRALTMLLVMAMMVTPLLAFAEDGEAAEDGALDQLVEEVETASPSLEILTVDLTPAGAKDSLKLKSIVVGEDRYFFLPSGSSGNSVKYNFDEEAVAYKVITSGNISSLYITSKDPDKKGMDYVHASKDNKSKGTLTMCDENLREIYSGAIDALKGRGNTTWDWTDKKSYQIKLDKKADLLDPKEGGQKAKKWVLLANPYDATLVRNEIVYNFAKEFGLESTPEGKPVDLYYDGLYRGSYYLCEKVEINPGRVDIADLEAATEEANSGVDIAELPAVSDTNSSGNEIVYTEGITDPEDITGGYLIEQDYVYHTEEKNWFQFGNGVYAVTKSPESVSLAQMEYISELFRRLDECAGNGGKVKNSEATLFDIADKESFVKYVLVMEWFRNIDTFTSSTFFYKPAIDEKIYLGPVWDCDSSMGNSEKGDSYKGWYTIGLGSKLLSDPEFRKAVKDVYTSEMRDIIYNELLGDTDGIYLATAKHTVEKIKPSADMNYMIWNFNDCDGTFYPLPTYEENVEQMLTWMQKRADWLDKSIMKKSFVTDGIKLAQEDKPEIRWNSSRKTAKIIFRKVPGATRYQVAYRKAGTSKWNKKTISGKNSCTLKGISKGKAYEFKVRAVVKQGKKNTYGRYSVIERVYFASIKPKVNVTDKGINVSWKKIKGVSGYELLYSKDNNIDEAESVSLKSGKSKYTIVDLEPETEYYIWIRPLKKYKGKTFTGIEKVKTITN